MGCTNDGSFGPVVQGCRDDFDFTVTFERIFMAIIPSAVFISLASTRLMYLWSSPRVVHKNLFQAIKLAVIVIFATINFSLLLLQTTSDPELDRPDAYNLTTAAMAVTFASSLFMLPLSYFEHQSRPRPSMLLTSYILITILPDIAQVRTAWLLGSKFFETLFARLFTCALVFKVLIFLLETTRKHLWVRWDNTKHSPEELAGILGLSLFSWLNKLFFAGYAKVLTDHDLYPLDSAMSAETLHARFACAMKTTDYKGHKYGLVTLLFKTIPVDLMVPLLPRLALVGFNYCQPFFMQAMLRYLLSNNSSSDASQHGKNLGYGLIGACIIIYLGIAFFSGLSGYLTHRSIYLVRACLATAIYEKTTRTRADHLEHSAPLTLMSADTERIVRSTVFMHDIWVNTFQGALGSYLLYKQLGAAFAAPIVTVFVSTLLIGGAAPFVADRQKTWMASIEKRVGLTSSVIGNMKSSKISGLVEPIERIVRGLRVKDIDSGNAWRFMVLLIVIISLSPTTLTPVYTFAVAAQDLGVTKIYTAMTFMVLLTQPLSELMQVVPPIQAALACCERIRGFLEQDAHVDFRNSSTGIGVADASSDILLHTAAKHGEDIPMTAYPVLTDGPAMSISRGYFGWEKEKMALNDINIVIPRGKLTLVVGPVASGKSTLCKALLGETVWSSGTVTAETRNGQMGFCDQVPFLLNATLKENIVGFSRFDQAKYDAIIQATMLSLDVSLLPQGHDTKIGSNGIMLSGGQKQRVSLARALYLESEIIILDDILSGLDNDTETQVFCRVFGPDGLLRQRHATVVLCTHSVRHLPTANHIIALSANGTIAEEGTFTELMKLGNYISSLGLQKKHKNNKNKHSNSETTVSDDNTPNNEIKDTNKDAIVTQAASGSANLSNELDNARQIGDWSVYKVYFKATGHTNTVFFILTSILYGFSGNFSTAWLGFWTEGKLGLTQSDYLGVFGLLRVLQVIFMALGFWLSLLIMVRRSGIQLHNKILATVMTAPLRFFATTDTGIVTNLFSQDLSLLDMELPVALANVGGTLMDTIGISFVVAMAAPWLAISYPFLVAVLWFLQRFYLRTSRQLRLLDLEAKSPLYSHFIDTIKGAITIRAFGWTNQNILHNHTLLNTSQRPAYLLAMVQQWLSVVLNLIVAAIAFLLVTLATQLNASAGFAGASFISLLTFGQSLTILIQTYTLLETSIGAVARIQTFSTKVKPENKPDEDVKPLENWPSSGQIVIDGVSASYGSCESILDTAHVSDATLSTPKLALSNLCLTIIPSSKVAICGRSGSGKSSLVLLLLKLLEPTPETSTNMFIDGVPLHQIDRTTLRRRIIAIPQDAVFLPAGSTIRENVDPFGDASDALCEEVLAQVKLGRWLEDKGGVGCSMDGEALSAGQKQLFNLGRAIIRRRIRDSRTGGVSGYRAGGLLMLDEVSSGVDTVTEREMQEIIKEEFASYTVIMISHRLDMVVDFATRVIVMDQGTILEDGVPKELLQQAGSRFRELWVLGNVGKKARHDLSGDTVS